MPDTGPEHRLDPATAETARRFFAQIAERYPLAGGYVFGSRARQTQRADSDADIAVILRGPGGTLVPTLMDLADIAFDVLLETGINIQPLPIWESEWMHPQNSRNPALLAAIARDGVRVA